MKKTPLSTAEKGLERLERALAHRGLASRREAKALISAGKVSVNGKIIREPGFGIALETDTVTIAGNPIGNKESVLVYKPRGIETNKTTPGAKDLHDAFPKFKHLSPIGRLDKESEGLIIMSNDGTLTKALTKMDSHIGKTYLVTTREPISDSNLTKMSTGILIDNILTKPAQTERRSRTSFTITLHEGRKHQIRRMCDACRLTIVSLLRIQIGHLKIGPLAPGATRTLGAKDIALLKK